MQSHFIDLQDKWKHDRPPPLLFIQYLLHDAQHGFICGFILPIALQVPKSRISELNLPLLAKRPKWIIDKLVTFVNNKNLGKPNSINQVSPHKCLHIFVLCASVKLYLDPFSKIVSYRKDKLFWADILRSGVTMSNLHCMNGQELNKVVNSSSGVCEMDKNCWHLS